MDFEKLLLEAKKNELNKKEKTKCLTTKFKPPSKEQREKERVLSEGVQRFLQRKEQEEKQKREEAERRKLELLALRAKDPKAHKRVQTMLKRTKSANKSVMEDAVDNNNTADTLAGPAQPDEDDYGFVSETSSALYNKLIQKMYSTGGDDNKFTPSKKPSSSNLMGTKERVKMALLRQEEEEKLPHKRSRKSKDKSKDGEDDGVELNYNAPDRDVSNHSSGSDRERPEKPKQRKPMPPPVNFQELLRIAEKKQYEPVVVEPKVKKIQEPEVLMTKKQKLEFEKMQEYKKKRELKEQGLDVREKSKDDPKAFKKIPKIGQTTSDSKSNGLTSQKTQKISQNDQKIKPDISKASDKNPNKSREISDKSKPKSVQDRKPNESEEKYKDISEKMLKLKREREETLRKLKELEQAEEEAARLLKEKEKAKSLSDKSQKSVVSKNPAESEKRNGEKFDREEMIKKLRDKSIPREEREKIFYKLKQLDRMKSPVKNGDIKNNNTLADKSNKSSQLNSKNSVESIKPNSSKPEIKSGSVNTQKVGSRDFPPKDVVRSREFPPKDVLKGREFPPKDVVRSRQFPPQDIARKRFPPGDVRKKPQQSLKRRRIESDEEYDSEMDDFIDDGEDEDQIDISKEISSIFGYDKNKYSRYDDDDDECMESNFAQISKEEFLSAKHGLLEDLRDIQREKAIKARKKNR